MKTITWTKKFLNGPLKGITVKQKLKTDFSKEIYPGKIVKEILTGTRSIILSVQEVH